LQLTRRQENIIVHVLVSGMRFAEGAMVVVPQLEQVEESTTRGTCRQLLYLQIHGTSRAPSEDIMF
jgi:hypothetical protein